jgi:hypothetical protein
MAAKMIDHQRQRGYVTAELLAYLLVLHDTARHMLNPARKLAS